MSNTIPEQRCEVELDAHTGKFSKIRFYNLQSDEREEQEQVAAKRVEQISKQLEYPKGLTNRERRRLDQERTVLQKAFPPPAVVADSAKVKEQRKLKAAEKKLHAALCKSCV